MLLSKDKLPTITIIGSGNLAWHLCHLFKGTGIKINKIISRNIESAKLMANEAECTFTNDLSVSNIDSDLLIIAVSDTAIGEVAESINTKGVVLVHTSGSIPMDILKSSATHYGVLYPLQTLTKGVSVDRAQIPFCIEVSDDYTLELINKVALKINDKVHIVSSDKRRIIHLAGVMINNFTNYLGARAFDYVEKNGINKEILFPLLEETISKLRKTNPENAQTGPARRKDITVIETHLKMLENEPELKNLYKIFSDCIIAYYS